MKSRTTHFPPCLSSLLSLVLATLLSAFTSSQAGPPPNDDIANASVINSDSFSVNGTEVGASQEPFEMSANFPPTFGVKLNKTVWYSYTPDASGQLKVEARNDGTNGDVTAVIFFKGPATPSQSTFVAETSPGLLFFVAEVTAKQQYFFFVGNNETTAHPFTLTGTFVPTVTVPIVTMTVLKPDAIRSTGVAAKVLVELSSAPEKSLKIAYTVKGTAVNGTDYALLTGSATVAAGQKKAAIKIKPLHGAMGTRTVKLAVVAGQGYTLGSPHKGQVTILEFPGK
jgi:hypothetical protein